MLSHSWLTEELKDLKTYNENSFLSQANIKIHEECLFYLEKTGSLNNVERVCMNYENQLKRQSEQNCFSSLRYPIEINLEDLKIYSESLCKLFVEEPSMAGSLVKKVMYSFILSKLTVDDFRIQHLDVPLRFKSVTSLPQSYPPNIPFGKLTSIIGCLISISTLTKHIRSYAIKCSQDGLEQRVFNSMPQQMPKCYICGTSMEEIPEAREMGEHISGLMIQLPGTERKINSSERKQAICVRFPDDLMSGLEPGLEYEIIGVMGTEYYQALSLTTKTYLCKQLIPKVIPASIRTLYHQITNICPASPWAFVGTLASNMSTDDFPSSCYYNLKMGLLLSLASQKPNANPVPILAAGTDTHVAHRLMRWAASLLQKGSVLEWAQSSPSGQMHWETTGVEEIGWVEAGPLLLAAGGVCCLGDWAKLKGKAAQTVLSALESRHISVDSSKPRNIPLASYPLRCAVWTYKLWNEGQKPSGANQIKPLIQVFGIPFLASDKNTSELMTYFTLMKRVKAMSMMSPVVISDKDFTEFLAIITSQDPTISPAASQLIQKYFVASRRADPDHLPVNAVSTLTSLAEGYARLALHSEVLPQHVAAVIQLYEESLMYLYGSTATCCPPVKKPNENFPQWVHQTVEEFTVWLEGFIQVFEGSISQYSE